MGFMASHAADRALEGLGRLSDRGKGQRNQGSVLGRLQHALP